MSNPVVRSVRLISCCVLRVGANTVLFSLSVLSSEIIFTLEILLETVCEVCLFIQFVADPKAKFKEHVFSRISCSATQPILYQDGFDLV